MESTKSMPNFPYFLDLLKELHFLKEQVPFVSMLGHIFAQIPKYIGKDIACTCFAIIQYKMGLLKLNNQNKVFMAAILKKIGNHPYWLSKWPSMD